MSKKTIIIRILVGLAFIIGGLIVVVATRPGEFRVTRTATIPAPPSAVFAQINDLQQWNAWSPWAKLDPAAKNTFEGPTSGKGAIFAWAGNNDVGEGRMTIIESQPDELVRLKLDFIKPFESTSTTEFTFKPEGEQTVVTWTMAGKNNFIGKGISLFIDCDKMIGDQFEQGFANMKSLVETSAKKL